MDKINCLIVDDEPIAREILQSYCSHLQNLHVISSCSNALQAKAALETFQVEILFLDINMPVLDGIAFLKTLRRPPQTIFTTAYKEYALNAFDLSACDYLLKPFSLERFMVAVDKAMERLKVLPMPSQKKTEDIIFIKAEGKIHKIFHGEILFAEAQGNYTKIVTSQLTVLPVMVFSNFTELLPASSFIRLHRSFIINKSKITHIEGNRVYINKIEIPIGSNYRKKFLKGLGF